MAQEAQAELEPSGLTKLVILGTFVVCSVVTCVIVYLTREKASSNDNRKHGGDFWSFQRLYLGVYLLAMFSDWLQGPYVYALYQSYGFSDGDNATLFVAGFGSSMIFGTVVGSMADSTGRKKAVLLYCLMYISSCVTKHVSSYAVLMVGRVTGGIATSLLFSIFETWMVCEHNARGFAPELLGDTFGMAIFGNSLVAILAGIVSQFAADALPLTPPKSDMPRIHYGGYCSPFDVSIMCLLVCGLVAHVTWTENFGERTKEASFKVDTMVSAAKVIAGDTKVLCCGVVSSLFESSMFIFVFKWTPAVTTANAPPPPYGHIFTCFMVASMLGSRVFSIASKSLPVERIGLGVLVVSMVTHLMPVVSSDPVLNFFSFILFELAVGCYFPMMGTLKGQNVPESLRSTIYNLFRVPLNFIVVSSLLLKLSTPVAFTVTFCLLGCALLAQTVLVKALASSGGRSAREPKELGPVTLGAENEDSS